MNQLNQEDSPQRSATRAPVNRPVRLQFDDSVEVAEGHCVNVSIGGMYIQLHAARPQGSLVRFELLVDEEHSIRGLGEVVWMRSSGAGSGREPGVGIKFRFLEQRDRQQIFKLVSQYIKERLSQRPAMTASPIQDVPTPVVEQGVIFRPPEEPVSTAPRSIVPEVPPPPPSDTEDLAGALSAPRRAASQLSEVEGFSGPLDLVHEAEPWQAAREFEESGPPGSFLPDASSSAGQAFDEEFSSAERRRPPALVLAGLLVLALILVLAFFWGDVFGPGEPSVEGSTEAPADTSAAPAPPVEGADGVPASSAEAHGVDPSSLLPEPPAATSTPPVSRPVSRPVTPPPSATSRGTEPAASAASPAVFNQVLDLTWHKVPGGLEVVFTTNGSIPKERWSHFRLSGATPREVVRILGVTKAFGKTQLQVDGPGVRQIRVGYHTKPRGNELHIVMDMSGPQAKISEIKSQGSQLVVRVEVP